MMRNELSDQIIRLQTKIDAINQNVGTYQVWQCENLMLELSKLIDDLKDEISEDLIKKGWSAYFKLIKRQSEISARKIYKRPKITPAMVDEDPLTLAGIQRS